MKIDIPKMIVQVDLGEYAKELTGKKLYCWVNLPLVVISEYSLMLTDMYEEEFEKENKGESEDKKADFVEFLARKRETPVEQIEPRRLEWFARVLSQGPEETHWTLDELSDLEQKDPSFLAWMISTYWNTRVEHLRNKKKH